MKLTWDELSLKFSDTNRTCHIHIHNADKRWLCVPLRVQPGEFLTPGDSRQVSESQKRKSIHSWSKSKNMKKKENKSNRHNSRARIFISHHIPRSVRNAKKSKVWRPTDWSADQPTDGLTNGPSDQYGDLKSRVHTSKKTRRKVFRNQRQSGDLLAFLLLITSQDALFFFPFLMPFIFKSAWKSQKSTCAWPTKDGRMDGWADRYATL